MGKLSSFIFALCVTAVSLQGSDWASYKKRTLEKISHISGWCTNEKALLIMDTIKANQCQNCIEIGVFAGKSLIPIARALKHNESGIVYGIDAWELQEAIKGLHVKDPNIAWYNTLNFEELMQQTRNVRKKYELKPFCKLVKKTSLAAVNDFANESIDFIHFDGSHSEEVATQDILNYFPKVKNGGFILLSNPNNLSNRQALVYLLERAELKTGFSRESNFLLFVKSSQRIENANKVSKGL